MSDKTFDSYFLRIGTGKSGKVATISCLAGRQPVGIISFYEDYENLTNSLAQVISGVIHLSMPMSRFESIMTMIRHEKPLIIGEYNGSGWITTTNEPVGEQEPVAPAPAQIPR